MTREEFQKAVALFHSAFPGYEFKPKLWWPVLSELDGEACILAVQELIKSKKELFPGSNPLAEICEHHDALIAEWQKSKTRKITVESEREEIQRWEREAAPPPPEWYELKQRLGAETD